MIEVEVKKSYARALIDDIDHDLKDIKWIVRGQSDGISCSGRRSFTLARLILARKLGRPLKRGEYVDFINKNNHDCRRSNLRIANPTQRLIHSRIYGNNSSGYRGVSWHKRKQKWIAQIGVGGKNKFLGYFDNKYDAHIAYCRASKEHYGEFTYLE